MIKKYLHITILILFLLPPAVKKASGQEFPWSLQYITNMHILNPAYVGMWDKGGFMVATRTNWVGFSKSPLAQQFSYHTPIKNETSGVGLNIRNMNTGREKQLFMTFDYSYQIRTDLTHYLRFGLRAGIVNFDNNITDYQLYPDRIPDLEFTTDVRMYFMSTLGLGAVFYNDNYFISLSIPQYINNTFKANRNVFSTTREFETVYLTGGYVFQLPKSVRLRPNLLIVRTSGKPIYADLAAVVYLPNALQLGVNLRSNGEMTFSGQYSFKNSLRIGYAADYSIIQDIRKYQLGTYEVVLGYDFNIYKRKYTKPNFF